MLFCFGTPALYCFNSSLGHAHIPAGVAVMPCIHTHLLVLCVAVAEKLKPQCTVQCTVQQRIVGRMSAKSKPVVHTTRALTTPGQHQKLARAPLAGCTSCPPRPLVAAGSARTSLLGVACKRLVRSKRRPQAPDGRSPRQAGQHSIKAHKESPRTHSGQRALPFQQYARQ